MSRSRKSIVTKGQSGRIVTAPFIQSVLACNAVLRVSAVHVSPKLQARGIAAAIEDLACDPYCPAPATLRAIAEGFRTAAEMPASGYGAASLLPVRRPHKDQEWFTFGALGRARFSGLPLTNQAIERWAHREGLLALEGEGRLWRRSPRNPKCFELHRTALPPQAIAELRGDPTTSSALPWLTAGQILKLGLPGLPRAQMSLWSRIVKENWRAPEQEGVTWKKRSGIGPGGQNYLYHVSILPEPAKAELLRRGLWSGSETSPSRAKEGSR